MVLKSLLHSSKGILYCSPKGNSEYSKISKYIVKELSDIGVPLSWTRFTIDDSLDDNTDSLFQEIKKEIDKNIYFDVAIFQCNPNDWHEYIEKLNIKFLNKTLIGYLIINNNHISDLWISYCNSMNQIWVSTSSDKEILEKYKVTVPIKVVPFPHINLNNDCPIVLKSGWYPKEKINENYIVQSSDTFSLLIKDTNIDYIKLYLNLSNKVFDYINILNPRKQKIHINASYPYLLLNTKGISFLECSIDFIKNEKLQNKRKGIILEKIEIIKNGISTFLDINSLKIENETVDLNKSILIPNEIESSFKFNTNLNVINIEIQKDTEFTGINYIGQYGTCGYATAAKGNLFYFFDKGIPVSWTPLYFDDSELSDDCMYNIIVKSLINKPIESINTIILHSTPDLWPGLIKSNKNKFHGKKIIGYTVWETNKLPMLWVEYINDSVDEVWCPSSFNKNVFISSGINIPIKVFPHVFLKKTLPNRESISIKLSNNTKLKESNDVYTFYNISELNTRKGVEDLIKIFCESFTKTDGVRLIIKIHYKNYDNEHKKICINKLNDIIKKYNNPPTIEFIIDNLSDKEILALHSIGDCYITLCKGEGFGLTVFEAFNYGKKIIATGYGGYLDFLGKDYNGLVNYKMEPVQYMESFSKNYTSDQEWACPDLNHAKELMIKATNNL